MPTSDKALDNTAEKTGYTRYSESYFQFGRPLVVNQS